MSVDQQVQQAADLGRRMKMLADEIVDPLICRTPAHGAPGRPHCAACCYGTGVIITCEEDQAMVDAAKALHRAADMLLKDLFSHLQSGGEWDGDAGPVMASRGRTTWTDQRSAFGRWGEMGVSDEHGL